jgi:ABC-2 type transport system ATP-binding protein
MGVIRDRRGDPMTQPLLCCENLGVSYGARKIFGSVDLSLTEGAYALRGPNGIGKSTLLKLLAGAHRPDTGRIWINGVDLLRAPVAARRNLSYVADESRVYPFMTGQDLLDFVAGAKRTRLDDETSRLIADFGLRSHLDVRFDAMSLGTRKKMMICAASIGAPRVLLMDEPSNGLDAVSRTCLEGIIRSWGKRNVILLSTHDDDFLSAIGAKPIVMEGIISSRRS